MLCRSFNSKLMWNEHEQVWSGQCFQRAEFRNAFRGKHQFLMSLLGVGGADDDDDDGGGGGSGSIAGM